MVNIILHQQRVSQIVPKGGFMYASSMKKLLLGAAVLVCAALPIQAGEGRLSLAPVPYELALPQEINSHLSTGQATEPFAEEVKQAGAAASTLVYYQPAGGEKTILMAVYYFPAGRFDAARKPDEPPRFGQEVIRKDGMVLSIAGPHDTIYDPDTADGQNITKASELIYSPESYLAQ